MNLDEQVKVVVDVIDELKGEEIVTLNVLEQSVDMEAIIVATGQINSARKRVSLTILKLRLKGLI